MDHGVEARQSRLLRCVSARLTFCWASLVDAQTVLSHISDISRCLLVLDNFFPFPLRAVARLNAPEALGVEEVCSKFSAKYQNQRVRRQPNLHVIMSLTCCDAVGLAYSYKFYAPDRFGLAWLRSEPGPELE